jgi:hypothetical protein
MIWYSKKLSGFFFFFSNFKSWNHPSQRIQFLQINAHYPSRPTRVIITKCLLGRLRPFNWSKWALKTFQEISSKSLVWLSKSRESACRFQIQVVVSGPLVIVLEKWLGLAYSLKEVLMGSLSTKIFTSGSSERIIMESSSFWTTHTKRPANNHVISDIQDYEILESVYFVATVLSIVQLIVYQWLKNINFLPISVTNWIITKLL